MDLCGQIEVDFPISPPRPISIATNPQPLHCRWGSGLFGCHGSSATLVSHKFGQKVAPLVLVDYNWAPLCLVTNIFHQVAPPAHCSKIDQHVLLDAKSSQHYNLIPTINVGGNSFKNKFVIVWELFGILAVKLPCIWS